MVHRLLSFSWAFAVLTIAACGDSAGPRCVEGSTQACVCAGGVGGAQICIGDGSYGACDCGDDSRPRDSGVDTGSADAFSCPDEDGDGHANVTCGGDDCDDADGTRFPGNAEVCDADDEDCNDTTVGMDADNDGFVASFCCNGAGNCGGDCDDSFVTINPSAAEVCNGRDDDCDGETDESVCVDECTLGMYPPCSGWGATCIDTFTGYTCGCMAGFSGPTFGQCNDIDECATGVDDCDDSPDACVNYTGGFGCTCPLGVGGMGRGASGCTGTRFTDLGDGTVRDNNGSGLLWQAGFSPGTQSHAESITYCTTLTLVGGGWRLATGEELGSLLDSRFAPMVDPVFFPGTGTEGFWTADLFETGGVVGGRDSGSPFEILATVLYFGSYDGGLPLEALANTHYARCVR